MKKQKGKAMANKNNEAALTEALYEAITATDEQTQQEAARRAHMLAEVVSSRALARAKKAALEKRDGLLASLKPRKRKQRLPDEQPQLTAAVAMSAAQAFGQVCDKHEVDSGCRDIMWQCLATVAIWQLKQKKGPFYEQARAEGALPEVLS